VFNWRRRNEGFEWREYVRTTILVRRKDRRERVKQGQAAAFEHLKDAGRRGVKASASGARSASKGLLAGMQAAATLSSAFASGLISAAAALISGSSERIASGVAVVSSQARTAIFPRIEPLLGRLRNPTAERALKIAAPLAGIAALYRAYAFGLDWDTIVVGAAALMAAALFAILRLSAPASPGGEFDDTGERENLLVRIGDKLVLLPGLDRLRPQQATLLTGALLAAVAASLWFAAAPATTKATTTAHARSAAPVSHVSSSETLEGRATATSGATLRISGTSVVLDGIEAPEPSQSCAKPNGATWRCGETAKEELASAVRGRRVSCELTGKNRSGIRLARCITAGEDIAAKLVRDGHVFASDGFFSSYSSQQAEARNAKTGLWAGDAERPADYRSRRWEEAKRARSDGCPIKGRVTTSDRIYVLPWSASYETVRISPAKGERWFCSEAEAQAAGFRAQS
jgi:endonuclease YncB( thermonuclease family)